MESQSPDISSTLPIQSLAPRPKWLPTSLPLVHTDSFEDYVNRFVDVGLITSDDFQSFKDNEKRWADLSELHKAAVTVVTWSESHGATLEGMQAEDQKALLEFDDDMDDAIDLLTEQFYNPADWPHVFLGPAIMWQGFLIKFITDSMTNVLWRFLAKLRQSCPALMVLWEKEAAEEEAGKPRGGKKQDEVGDYFMRDPDLGDHPMER